MRRSVLMVVMLLFYFHSQAQDERDTFQAGIGGLPIIYPDNSLETGYSIRANLGYFLTNNLSVGLMPFIGKVEDIRSFGASVYLRYYVINSKFSLFTEVHGGFGRVTYENSPEFNGAMNAVALGPGVHYQFKNNLAIEILIQYARLRNINYPESTLIGNTLIPTIGFQYFIHK